MWSSKPFEPSCADGVWVKRAVIGDPGTVVSTARESDRPPMHTALASVQARTGTSMVTSPKPSGATVTSQAGFALLDVTRAPVTLPPVTSSTEAASRVAESPAGWPLNWTTTVNAVAPSWPVGTSSNLTSGPVLRPELPDVNAPLCASSASTPLPALRMVPPLRARLSGVTAM